jgi:hypothetical protein
MSVEVLTVDQCRRALGAKADGRFDHHHDADPGHSSILGGSWDASATAGICCSRRLTIWLVSRWQPGHSQLASSAMSSANQRWHCEQLPQRSASGVSSWRLSEADGGRQDETVLVVGRAEHGDLRHAEHGTVVYTPPRFFAGSDTFSYTLTDAAGRLSTSTVTVTKV